MPPAIDLPPLLDVPGYERRASGLIAPRRGPARANRLAIIPGLTGAPGLFIGSGRHVSSIPTVIELTTTGTSSWTVPDNWNSVGATIDCYGGGGNGGSGGGTGTGGGGGGGGAFARWNNFTLTPGQTLYCRVGVGGGSSTTGLTWVNKTSNANPTSTADGVRADEGQSTSDTGGAAGGSAASSVGDVKYSGGNGNNGSSFSQNGAGGGCAGSSGNASGSSAGPGGTYAGNGGSGGGSGSDGYLYGGGAGGAEDSGSYAGRQGIIVITYYAYIYGPEPVAVFNQQASTSSTAQTISWPAHAAGDLAVLVDFASNVSGTGDYPAAVTPAGFVNLTNRQTLAAGTAYYRTMTHFRVCDGTEGASLTGMNGDNFNRKALIIFRANVGISSAAAGDVQNPSAVSSNPSPITVLASGDTPPLVVLGFYVALGTISPRTFTVGGSDAKDGELGFHSSQMYIAWKLFASSPSNVVVDMADEGSYNYIAGAALELAS